ncbi:MAG: NADH-ubiquinone oxidoreductase-F iron-sulfur binding region domain-containing protein, partial [Jatrophihabitantaceae bacterium]
MTAPLRLVIAEDDVEPGLLPKAVRYLGDRGGALTELEPKTLRMHHRDLGTRPQFRSTASADALIDELERIGLTGRGGGHFPAATKWRAVRSKRSAAGIVVANGAEGEPRSRKDAALLELRPHLILDGLACAAETVGAAEAVIWLHAGDHPARSAITRALTERQAAELDEPSMRIALGPDHYLTGESSAVVEGVFGRPARPQFHRVHAALGEPSILVHNVETLARVALAARGDDATRTVLVSVTDGDSIVVLEVPDRHTVQGAVRAALGEVRPQAVLLGGYGGVWVDWDAAAGPSLRQSDLQRHSLSLGAGVLETLPAGRCGLVEAARIARFLSDSSARQCGPCLFGLSAIADSLTTLSRPSRWHRRESTRLAGFVSEVRGRGACHHPDGAARMVASALQTFKADVSSHL